VDAAIAAGLTGERVVETAGTAGIEIVDRNNRLFVGEGVFDRECLNWGGLDEFVGIGPGFREEGGARRGLRAGLGN
jgi:hypothetical protein